MKPCLNAQIPWDAVNAERFGDLRRRAFRLCDEASRARSSRLGVACLKPARSDRSAMQHRPAPSNEAGGDVSARGTHPVTGTGARNP